MIYLIITTTIHNLWGIRNEEQRKQLYLSQIEKTLSLLPSNIKPIIVENSGLSSSYLDQFNSIKFNCPVVYTNNNKYRFRHKGMNELLDIKYTIKQYDIKDEDTIIKLTGRYSPLNDQFFLLINDSYEAYVKFFNVCTLEFMDYDCVLGMFAIKCKYLKLFKYNVHFNESAEVQFAKFVKQNVKKLYCVKELNLSCVFADNNRILHV